MIMMELSRANLKLDKLFENRVNITQHTHDVTGILRDKLVKLLMHDGHKNIDGKEISKYDLWSEIRETILTVKKQRKLRKMDKLTIIEYNLEKQTKKLSKIINPKKKFETFIRQR